MDIWRFFFSIDAEVSFLVNDEVYHVKRGDLVISRPGDVHVCIFPKDAVYSYYCLWIDADFSSPFFAFLAKKDFSPLISLDMEEVTAVASALNALYTLPEEKKRSVKEMSMLLTVLLEAFREFHGNPERRRRHDSGVVNERQHGKNQVIDLAERSGIKREIPPPHEVVMDIGHRFPLCMSTAVFSDENLWEGGRGFF